MQRYRVSDVLAGAHDNGAQQQQTDRPQVVCAVNPVIVRGTGQRLPADTSEYRDPEVSTRGDNYRDPEVNKGRKHAINFSSTSEYRDPEELTRGDTMPSFFSLLIGFFPSRMAFFVTNFENFATYFFTILKSLRLFHKMRGQRPLHKDGKKPCNSFAKSECFYSEKVTDKSFFHLSAFLNIYIIWRKDLAFHCMFFFIKA